MTSLSYDSNQLAGVVILAGGLSTRMGSPKALLTLPSGQTLLDYHVDSAKQLGVPILIADNEQGFNSSFDNESIVIHISDFAPQNSSPQAKFKHSAGPLGAILSAMQQLLAKSANDEAVEQITGCKYPSKWLIVVSCDSLIAAVNIWKFINTESKATLASKAAKILCLTDNQKLYPLLGLYQLSVAHSLKTYLDAGERRVMGFIRPRCHQIVMPETWYPLSNLNTPEQFQLGCQRLRPELTMSKNQSNSKLSHLDADGDIHMVDVGHKTATTREALAEGYVVFPKDIYTEIKAADGMTKKGSITQTAHIAGIMAAKRTHDLIPLCHPLPIDKVGLSFSYEDHNHAIKVTATVRVTHKTGVEMEALTAVSVACLTLYDMTKALSHDIVINNIGLVTKTGGKSDYQKPKSQ